MKRFTDQAGREVRTLAAGMAIGLALVEPALANGSVLLPDPGGVTLLSLGLAGLIIGRRAAARRRDGD